MQRLIPALALLIPAAPLAADAPVKFTAPPTAKAEGGNIRIDFAVNRPTDAAVYVLDAKGRVVCHLAAGVLGDNVPASLKTGSLEQTLTWDGKNDFGEPAKGGPFQVRVAAGLKPTFDRFMLYNPDAVPRPHALATGPDGDVYVFYSDAVANGNQGGLKIKVLDRDGNHRRMIMPFPADLPHEKVKPFGTFEDEKGRLVPHVQNWQTLSFYPDTHSTRGRTMPPQSCPAVDSKGVAHWMLRGGRVASVDRHGGAAYSSFLSPPLFAEKDALQINERYDYSHSRVAMAVGEGDRYLYISGLSKVTGRKKSEPVARVYRVELKTRKAAEVFLGGEGDPRGLKAPRGIACAKGILYVADPEAGRIAAFNEKDGTAAGEIEAPAAHYVGVAPASRAVYVVAGKDAARPDLVKFDGLVSGREVCRAPLPSIRPPRGGIAHRMAVDASAEPVRIWVPVITFKGTRYCYVEDRGKTFEVRDDFLARRDKTPWANAARDLYLDRKRGELYVKAGGKRWLRFDEKTARLKDIVELNLGTGADATQMVVDSSGNLVTLSWGAKRGLMRWTRDGKPLNWDGKKENRTRWSGIMTFQQVYLAIHNDGLYVVPDAFWRGKSAKEESKKGPRKRVSLSVWGMDGEVKRTLIWQCERGEIPRVDAKGNIYLAAGLKPVGRHFPAFFDGQMKTPGSQAKPSHEAFWYAYMYGSIVKFPPEGGAIWYDDSIPPSVEGTPPASLFEKPTQPFMYRGASQSLEFTGKLQGAEWSRFGFSPYSNKFGGTAFCQCEGAGFDVDAFGRVFYPNLGQFRIEMVDTSNNRIGSFGHYGNQDSGGPDAKVKTPDIPLAWATYVAVSDDYAYVNDTINLRLVRVKLGYEAEAAVEIE
jgi:hypothetical protein